LPRRCDDERPPVIKPEAAAVADVRTVSLALRAFATRLRPQQVLDLRLDQVADGAERFGEQVTGAAKEGVDGAVVRRR
jgi:hypothetical protein